MPEPDCAAAGATEVPKRTKKERVVREAIVIVCSSIYGIYIYRVNEPQVGKIAE